MSDWSLAYTQQAVKQLQRLDPPIARRIRDALTALTATGQPRSRGHGMTDNLAGLWRYRVGDWRIVCDLQDDTLTVLTLDVGHRSTIYRR